MKNLITTVFVLLLLHSCSPKNQPGFSKTYTGAGPGYSKAVCIISGNIKTIYVSGLTGEGNDLEAQTRATFANIKAELEVSGATFKDVVKMNTFIVNYRPSDIEIFRGVRKEIMGTKDMPASTVVGVEALAAKDKLIEIEAIAVLKMNK
jgi:2-iminobutanoate/2-iminopropanoate deaminase